MPNNDASERALKRLMTPNMEMFARRFPEAGERETRVLHVFNADGLPQGAYAFLEFYCNDPACDCRRVLLRIVEESRPGKFLTGINFGWESPAFYRKWVGGKDPETSRGMAGASIEILGPQSKWGSALLHQFETQMLADTHYVERLKRHYAEFKEAVRNGHTGSRLVVRARPGGGGRRRKRFR